MSAKQLYQLFSTRPLSSGSYVRVNGPWDQFGIVLKSTAQDDGQHLNLIRGCDQRHGEKPVANF